MGTVIFLSGNKFTVPLILIELLLGDYSRVVSLLTEDWKLLDQVRCPAISRLQKIHNVGVALKSLMDRRFDLSGAKGTLLCIYFIFFIK